MKASKEVVLWAFFIAICFWAGYLKGYLPISLQPKIFNKDPVRILNAMPFALPPSFVNTLSEELGQRVVVHNVRNWEDLQVKMVVRAGDHVLLAPIHWAPDLERQGLIVGLSLLQAKIEKYISADFLSEHGKSPLAMPLYWTLTQFVVSDKNETNSLDQALNGKEYSQLRLYPDADLILRHLQDWNHNISATLLKNLTPLDLQRLTGTIPKDEIWEVPRLLHIQGAKTLASNGSEALLSYGAMIPKNSVNRRISYHVLEKILDPLVQERLLQQWPFGSTLKPTEGLKVQKDQNSAEVRDLNLRDLILLDHRNLEGLHDLYEKYNLTF